jgi:hypothetical protein
MNPFFSRRLYTRGHEALYNDDERSRTVASQGACDTNEAQA